MARAPKKHGIGPFLRAFGTRAQKPTPVVAPEDDVCVRCAYPLVGLEGPGCPECAYPVAASRRARGLLRFAPAESLRAIAHGLSALRTSTWVMMIPVGLMVIWFLVDGRAASTGSGAGFMSLQAIGLSAAASVGIAWVLCVVGVHSLQSSRVEGIIRAGDRARLLVWGVLAFPASFAAYLTPSFAARWGIYPRVALVIELVALVAPMLFYCYLLVILKRLAAATRVLSDDDPPEPDKRLSLWGVVLLFVVVGGDAVVNGKQPPAWPLALLVVAMAALVSPISRVLVAVRFEMDRVGQPPELE